MFAEYVIPKENGELLGKNFKYYRSRENVVYTILCLHLDRLLAHLYALLLELPSVLIVVVLEIILRFVAFLHPANPPNCGCPLEMQTEQTRHPGTRAATAIVSQFKMCMILTHFARHICNLDAIYLFHLIGSDIRR